MEWLNLWLSEYGIWILSGGLFMVLLLQTITLHKIRKTGKLLKQIEISYRKEEKVNPKVQLSEENQPEEEEKTAEETGEKESALESQQIEESPEQLIDAVLAEVFR